MTADEKKWRAESDGRALMEAERIKDDPTRAAAAKAALDDIAEEKREEAKAATKAKGRVRGRQEPPASSNGNTRKPAPPPVPGTGNGGFSGSMM